VERQVTDGTEIVETSTPAVVTVSNELGQPRYPTLRGIMAATRKQPIIWDAQELGIDTGSSSSSLELLDLYIPTSDVECEIIRGEDDEESGRLLALKLREDKLI